MNSSMNSEYKGAGGWKNHETYSVYLDCFYCVGYESKEEIKEHIQAVKDDIIFNTPYRLGDLLVEQIDFKSIEETLIEDLLDSNDDSDDDSE